MAQTASDQGTRWRTLLDALAQRHRLSVADAADLLGVSAATVRRDFAELARQQLATRTHGGIVAGSVAYELPARYRVTADDPRERIAAEVAGRVEAGSVVAFNGGTTTTAAARHVGRRELESLTIVTNALNIAGELVLRPHIRTVVIGGEARPESYELHGPFASRVLDDLLVDDLFLGVTAMTTTEGARCGHLGEAAINAEMVEHARRVTVVSASPKFGRVGLARICAASAVDAVITDTALDDGVAAELESAGIEVTRV